MAPPLLPAAVVPAAISVGSGDHLVGLLVCRIEDQRSELDRMQMLLGARTGELERAKAEWADAM